MVTASVRVIEGDPAHPTTQSLVHLADGRQLSVGRSAEISIGAAPADRLLSRVAVRVINTGDSVLLDISNRNGAVLHRWGLPARPAGRREAVRWPRVGVRVVGGAESAYWVFVSVDGPGYPADTAPPGTDTLPRPVVRALTAAQQDAVREVFRDVLSWPPVVPARSVRLDMAAENLGVSLSAVQARLTDARTKARALGLAREVPLADPEYVHLLVRAGHLRPEHVGVDGDTPAL
jgi:hypothetical protein